MDIFTDGSCDNSTGHGGWAFVIPSLGIERYGGAGNTTSNRMEVMAILEALRFATPHPITIWSDSRYALGVCGGTYKAKMNLDLVHQAWLLRNGRVITFEWIKAHNGHKHNNRADRLAARGRIEHGGLIPDLEPEGRRLAVVVSRSGL